MDQVTFSPRVRERIQKFQEAKAQLDRQFQTFLEGVLEGAGAETDGGWTINEDLSGAKKMKPEAIPADA